MAAAVASCLLIGFLAWTGAIAVRGWQHSLFLLADRQEDDASRRFLADLTRDMQAAQRSVLLAPALTIIGDRNDPSYDVVNLVASAFARYSYPELFFLWRRESASGPIFFYRQERRPEWANGVNSSRRFPVISDEYAPVAARVLSLIQERAAPGQPFVVLETMLDGVPYQIIGRMLYRDPFRQNLDTVFGFMVNLNWVREHYFAELLRETESVDSSRQAVSLSIVDDQGRETVAGGVLKSSRAVSPSQRRFPVMFFNPLLVASEPLSTQPRRSWTIRAVAREDSSLIFAAAAANRLMVLQGVAAAVLAIGILLSLSAAAASLRLSELRSGFVTGVTHEFKTPIATIRAAGETLAAGRLTGVASSQKYAGFIVQEAKRLTRLVDNLLAFSSLTDAMEAKQPPELLAITDLVNDALERFSVQLTDAAFLVDLCLPKTAPPILGDPASIGLLLDNILDNVIRHSRQKHHLAVRLVPDSRTILLEIADSGGGIPADELKHVTKKFYRGRLAGHGGTGLGLSIVARIVAEHKGIMRVENENGGTSVKITLPTAPKEKPTFGAEMGADL